MQATVHVFSAVGDRIGIWESDQVGSVKRQMPFNGRQSIRFSVPRSLATAAMCQFGNLVVIESDTGVELWGGVIRGQRSWRLEGPTVSVQSWEAFLQAAITPTSVAYRGLNAGQIASRLLTDMQERYAFPIVIGNVSDAGEAVDKEYRLESIYTAITRLQADAARSLRLSRSRTIASTLAANYRQGDSTIPSAAQGEGFDWWIETAWDTWQSHPVGVFHLEPRAGRDTGLLLSEDMNVVEVNAVEDDERAVTSVTILGTGGESWNERPIVTENDPDLLDELQWSREVTEIRNDIRDTEALRAAAQGILSPSKRNLTVGITNDGGEWAAIRNGDTVLTNLPSFEFAGAEMTRRHRVVGRTVDEHKGIQTLQLVAEE